MNLPVTCGIPTKDRYNYLGLTLLSIANQISKPREVIIVDDSDNPKKINEIPELVYILQLLNHHGIEWQVIWGAKKGQHYSHQLIQERAKYDWIFRIDDDCVAEPEVLNYLWGHIDQTSYTVGAVAPLVLLPNPSPLPSDIPRNTLSSLKSAPNIQWFQFDSHFIVEHLHSCFIYKKNVARYNLNLSRVAHREETIFSHEIFRAGLRLIVEGKAKVWHFRANNGGIRTGTEDLFKHDEEIFNDIYRSWTYKEIEGTKIIVLDNGIGDHYAFLHSLDRILGKYPKITIAACFPDVFFEYKDKIKLISIAEAKLMFGNIDKFNVYTWMESHSRTSLKDAFNQLYV